MSLSRKTIGNASVLAVGTALEAAIQFLFLLIAGRELGPEEFGFYGYLLALVTLAATVAHFGLPVISVREIVRRPAEENSLFAATFRIRAVLSVTGFILALAISLVSPLTAGHRVAVWLIFLYILCVPFDLSFLFDAHKLSRWDVPGRLAGRIVSVGLLILLWKTKEQLQVLDVALCSSVLMIVNISTGWMIARRIRLPLPLLGRSTDTGSLIRQSAPIVWSNVLALTYTQNQTILVKALSTAVETGFYALTSRLLMPILILKGVLYRVLVPIISESAADRAVLTARLEKIIPILSLIFVPLSVLAIAATDVLLVPLFGIRYAGAVLPFQISMAIFVFAGIGSLFGSVVLACGDARTPTVGLTIGTGIALALSLYTIPRYGAAGAAVAAGAGELLSIAYALPKFLHLTRPAVCARLLKTLAASLLGLSVYLFLRWFTAVPPAVNFALDIAVTLLGLIVVKEISRQGITALWQEIRRPNGVAATTE
jgi:O-antigen/teichoic acid export membrane protein